MKRLGIYAMGISLLAATPAMADTFELTWYTVDGGGATFSTGGGYQLGGTIGQPDAQPPPVMAGGVYELTGGFWPCAVPQFAVGDMNCDGLINAQDIDGFIDALFNLTAAYDAYLHSFPTYHPCSMLNADFSGDGLVNSQDIDGFISALFGG